MRPRRSARQPRCRNGRRPFDRTTRMADVRHIDNGRGRHNVPNVGVFLFRLQPQRLTHATARRIDSHRYVCHPLGLDAPLVNVPSAENAVSALAGPRHVPRPIGRRALHDDLRWYYGTPGRGPQPACQRGRRRATRDVNRRLRPVGHGRRRLVACSEARPHRDRSDARARGVRRRARGRGHDVPCPRHGRRPRRRPLRSSRGDGPLAGRWRDLADGRHARTAAGGRTDHGVPGRRRRGLERAAARHARRDRDHGQPDACSGSGGRRRSHPDSGAEAGSSSRRQAGPRRRPATCSRRSRA